MSQFGNFRDFCRDSTLPVCNLFYDDIWAAQSCSLLGFEAAGGGRIRNLGLVLLAGLSVIVSLLLIWLADKKQAAVGRREIQILLFSFAVLSLTSIFSVGGFLDQRRVLVWFSALNIASVTATFWILMLFAIVKFQIIDDGTPKSIGLVLGSALALFIATGYIALDTAFQWTGHFAVDEDLKNYGLYVLYLLEPLIMIVAYIALASVVVLHLLGERKPMILLASSGLFFAIGQIFQFVISVHICNATSGKIDGSLFQTLFSLLSVITLYYFWTSITEESWSDGMAMSESNYA